MTSNLHSSRNLYTIVYNNRRCPHSTLRSFPKKRHFVCLGCGSDCQFCEICENVFTLKTLKKYGGICGKCEKKEEDTFEDALEQDLEDALQKALLQGHSSDDCDCDREEKLFPLLPKRSRTNGNPNSRPTSLNSRLNPQLTVEIPFMFPFQLLQQPPQVPLVENFDNQEIPISEMRVEKGEEKLINEVSEGIVKNILAEDPQKKLWLIEWDGEEHATWEDYSTIKDSVIFKEYIEKQMGLKT